MQGSCRPFSKTSRGLGCDRQNPVWTHSGLPVLHQPAARRGDPQDQDADADRDELLDHRDRWAGDCIERGRLVVVHRVQRVADHVGVVAKAAFQPVAARVARQHVVACTAAERVVTACA